MLRFFSVRLHKLKIVRLTRNLLTYEINGQKEKIVTRSKPSDIVPSANQRQPKQKKTKQPMHNTAMQTKEKKSANKTKKKERKKIIKVYGRSVRRPKRPLRPSQIRTIDILGDPIKVPEAVVCPKEEMGR